MFVFKAKRTDEAVDRLELYVECDWLKRLFGGKDSACGETNTGACENTVTCNQNLLYCKKLK
jgi:hypothetical protein